MCKRVRYCQLIRDVNKEKRRRRCQERIDNRDLELNDVTFTDECTVQLEAHRNILDATLVPFIRTHYPHHHRFQQDNYPKHTSRWAQDYLNSRRSIGAPSSPDLNPIENVWGSMKEYLRRVIKPKNTAELKTEFWNTLAPDVCANTSGT